MSEHPDRNGQTHPTPSLFAAMGIRLIEVTSTVLAGWKRRPAPDAIPAELRNLDRWACWSAGPDGKPPRNPRTGGYAKCNDPATWGTFLEAVDALSNHDGLQFALNGDGIVGIDLDACRDTNTGAVEPWAVEVIRRFNSYTEVSPSGAGIRIFVRGKLPPTGRKKGPAEVYDSNKFLTVTGRKLTTHGAGDGVEDRPAELLQWHKEVFGDLPTPTKGKGGGLTLNRAPVIDRSRLELLFLSKPNAKGLYYGGRTGHASQSEVDLALANYAIAAGWTDQEVCDLLVQARINADEKIKPLAYFQRTVVKARDGREAPTDSLDARQDTTPAEAKAVTGSWAELAEKNKRVRFLVKDWIPFGMITGVVGEPKAGKSAFVLGALVRPIITGGKWFTGQLGGDPGYVVWCDTERRAAVNLERADKWGLPVDHILTPFADTRQVVNIDDPDCIKWLTKVVRDNKVRLVVVDSYRGAHTRDENNSTIAVGLQALGAVCEETGTACVVIHHAKKMLIGEDLTINCGRGSNAFLAAVACQIAINRPDPKSEWRRVQVLGENLGIAPGPIGFRVTDAGLEVGEAPAKPEKHTNTDNALEWLSGRLRRPGEWHPSAEILEEGVRQLGYSRGTIQRAQTKLGVVVRKAGKVWEWRLPSP